jgi:hypothetical protein
MRGMEPPFSIRDLLWLVLVVAIAMVWRVDRANYLRKYVELDSRIKDLQSYTQFLREYEKEWSRTSSSIERQ